MKNQSDIPPADKDQPKTEPGHMPPQPLTKREDEPKSPAEER
jgi:hypothetical protein